MKKKNIIIIAVSCLLFLILSVPFILPIQAQSETTVSSISSSAMVAAAKTLEVYNTSSNMLVIQTQYQKTVIEKITETHYKIFLTNSTGFTHILDAITDGSKKSLLLDGKELLVNPTNSSLTQSNSTSSIVSGILLPQYTMSQDSQSALSVDQSQGISPLTDNINYFQWDGVNYVSGGSGSGSIKYPHPDEDYYGISIYNDWSYNGNNLQHNMINQAESLLIAEYGPWGIACVIGAIIGAAIGGIIGAAVGVVAGLVLGAYLWLVYGYQVQDENSNVWWWTSLAFLSYLSANAFYIYLLLICDYSYAIAMVSSYFAAQGYLRIGSFTFYDAIGAGNPNPSPIYYYVSSIAQYGTWAYGSVNNPSNLIGDADGNYAQIYGGNYNDGGNIVGWMDDVAHGHIYLYGYSGSGYYTHLYVYVSYNANNDWTQTSVQTVYGDGSGSHWIDCGSYSGSFRYIAIAAIDDNGMSANIFIDSVKVS